jgi:tetratricopeptide (TPR) repeat protein
LCRHECLELIPQTLTWRQLVEQTHEKAHLIELKVLAESHNMQNEYEQELSIRQQILKIEEETFGSESTDILDSIELLAKSYEKCKRYDEELTTYQRYCAMNEKILGADSSLMAILMNNLACSHERVGQYEAALDIYTRALAIFDVNSESPIRRSLSLSMASCFASRGDYEKALQIYLHLPTEKSSEIYVYIAHCYFKTRRFSECSSYLLNAIEYGKQHDMRSDQSYRLNLQWEVARLLEEQAKIDSNRLIPILDNLLDSMFSDKNVALDYVVGQFGRLYSELGREEDLAALQKRHAEHVHQAALDEADSFSGEAQLFLAFERKREAITSLQKALELHEKLRGTEHAKTIDAALSLYQLLSQEGEAEQAKRLAQKFPSILL